ncbi:MAG TPA: hypothetical protein VFV22_01475 [Candidatus Paceibacterota bacterium]|nr:hypothetical protein [Candidatus Paceibacterota bacterium]
MFVITVVPLKRGIISDTLSYYSGETYAEGTIITIPVRNATALGLVIQSETVSAAKTALRAATFSLKKLPFQKDAPILGVAYMQTANELTRRYPSSLGAILYNLLPPEIRNGDIPFPHVRHAPVSEALSPEVFQAPYTDRMRSYRSLVREAFARSGSVLLVAPTSIDADTICEELENGIDDRIIVLTATKTKSELKKAYTMLDDYSKTKLIIATPSHAIIERHDITLVIMEQVRSPHYIEMTRPYLDYRDVLRIHARYSGRRLIFADILPRTEEEACRRDEIYATYGETPKRIEMQCAVTITDMQRNLNDVKDFALIAPTTVDAIKDARRRKGNIFLFSPRRGLAPVVSCVDCGYIFRSPESGAPYSLLRVHKGDVEERWFVCPASGERKRAADVCESCGSWRLRERGIGIQHVYDELHKLFPTTPIILFDHLTARTYKKALFLRDNFYKTRGAILLGTQMAIPYLNKPVMLSCVVNMDALLATPTWRVEEENLALLLTIRERTSTSMVIQTRSPDVELLSWVKQGVVEQFYTEELKVRANFNYPPFVTFIHATWQGTEEQVRTIEQEIKTTLASYKVTTYPNPVTTRDKMIMHALVRVPRGSWPDEKLMHLLRAIHPSVRLMVNPDRIV